MAVSMSARRIEVLAGRIAELAVNTCDAYAAERFASWTEVVRELVLAGLTDRQVEAVVRSKWLRHAADESGAEYGQVPASAVLAYVLPRVQLRGSLESLEAATFGGTVIAGKLVTR